MGCIQNKGDRHNKKNDALYQQKIIKFNDYDGVIQVTQIQSTKLRIDDINYQLVLRRQGEESITEFQVLCESNFPLNQFYQNSQIFQHSIIENKQKPKHPNKYMKKSNSKYINIQKLYIIKQQQDCYFINEGEKIKLRSSSRNKTILMFKIGQPKVNKICFDQFNSRIIFLQQRENQKQFICVLNIHNRNHIRQPYSYQIDQIVSIQKTNDLLVQIQGIGIILYRIDLVNMRIDKIKTLNYNLLFQVCIIDNTNLLNLISNNFYLKFDKDYNVIQSLKINFDDRKYHFNKKQILQKKMSEQQMNQNQLITQFQNYQIEYTHRYGRTQHLISPNEKYLAYLVEQQLVVHMIQNKYDLQISFDSKIKFIMLNTNSNLLFVILKYSYRMQDLRKCSLYFINTNESLVIQNNILLTISKQGLVKVLSRQSNKLIFKLRTNKNYSSFDCNYKTAQILASTYFQINLYNLSDRKLTINQKLINYQCKMIQDNQQFFVLNQQKQLQLWTLQQKNLVLERIIMNDIKLILQPYQNKYCLRRLEQIIILDQNFNIIQQIYYQNDNPIQNRQGKQNRHLIGKWDQVIQENYILKLQQQTKESLKIDLYIDFFQFEIIRKVILQLETIYTETK